ncbi:MAG: ABC transporter ATP-binding protein [Thermodesulfobacteriota bacterium]
MLDLRDVDVYYGDAQALKGVSLRVNEGEIVALVGANGAGKSTTLKTIAGLLRPRRGRIEFLGEGLAALRPEEIVNRGISLVPEGRRLFTRMTVAENLELGAYPPRARARTADSLEQVLALFPPLKERFQEPAAVLSGGQQQMLAIGRALMSRPRLLMFDEPSLGLAPLMVQAMFEVIDTLHRHGVTVLLVEQNVGRSLKLAQYGFILKTGSIALCGSSQALLEDPGVKKAFLGIGGERA